MFSYRIIYSLWMCNSMYTSEKRKEKKIIFLVYVNLKNSLFQSHDEFPQVVDWNIIVIISSNIISLTTIIIFEIFPLGYIFIIFTVKSSLIIGFITFYQN